MKKAIITAALAALVSIGGAAQAAKMLSGKLNLNTASATELTLLPGVGEAKAASIIEKRKAKPFATKEELLLIKGIGDKLFAKMQPYVATEGPTTLVGSAASEGAGAKAGVKP